MKGRFLEPSIAFCRSLKQFSSKQNVALDRMMTKCNVQVITFLTMSSIPSVRAVTYQVMFIIQWPTCSAILARRTLTWALRFKEQLLKYATVGCHTHFASATTVIRFSEKYPTSKGFFLAWLLAFTKSFACLSVAWLITLVCLRPVASFSQGVNKTNQATDKPRERLRKRQSHAREKPLLAGYRNKQSKNNGPSKTKTPGFLFRGDGGT